MLLEGLEHGPEEITRSKRQTGFGSLVSKVQLVALPCELYPNVNASNEPPYHHLCPSFMSFLAYPI